MALLSRRWRLPYLALLTVVGLLLSASALQAYRLAHHVWNRGRRDLALYLQSRVSEVFQCDIHPAARIGRGVRRRFFGQFKGIGHRAPYIRSMRALASA